jgi:hypothetical protein
LRRNVLTGWLPLRVDDHNVIAVHCEILIISSMNLAQQRLKPFTLGNRPIYERALQKEYPPHGSMCDSMNAIAPLKEYPS